MRQEQQSQAQISISKGPKECCELHGFSATDPRLAEELFRLEKRDSKCLYLFCLVSGKQRKPQKARKRQKKELILGKSSDLIRHAFAFRMPHVLSPHLGCLDQLETGLI